MRVQLGLKGLELSVVITVGCCFCCVSAQTTDLSFAELLENIPVIKTSRRRSRTLVPRSINATTFVASIFGPGEARRGSIPRSGAVTEEQRSQNRKATQPSGRRFFLAQTSLLTPYRPLKGMLVARASSGPKIPRRKRGRIYEMEYLAGSRTLQRL